MSHVNVLSEALDGLGRWYVAVPPFLIAIFLAVLFFLTGAGQARLQEAGERLQQSAEREHAIDALQDSIARAIAAQRGYLLSGDHNYFELYDKALAEVEPRLESLRTQYNAATVATGDVHDLTILIGKRLADLALLISMQDKQGAAAATALLKSSLGLDTGQAINKVLDGLREHEAAEHGDAASFWGGTLSFSRWITYGGIVVNMLLIGIASRLVFVDIRRRQQSNEQLRDQKSRLEREVEERTRELMELSTHLQSVAEREKASLARELHDELGGLLVGARMDISWAEQHLSKIDPATKLRLDRVQESLAAGVDLKRRIIEELRPTLLDNVGLFAALRWQLKETCGRAGIRCTESYPEEEPRFKSEASIALYRIAQEAFNNVVKHSQATTVDVSLDLDEETLLLRIVDDGTGIPAGRFTAIASHGLASMRHRVRALGGRLDVRSPAESGTVVVVQVPLANALLQTTEQEPT
jgi:signal transduction histidine kinase